MLVALLVNRGLFVEQMSTKTMKTGDRTKQRRLKKKVQNQSRRHSRSVVPRTKRVTGDLSWLHKATKLWRFFSGTSIEDDLIGMEWS